jgi:hypothetical protein
MTTMTKLADSFNIDSTFGSLWVFGAEIKLLINILHQMVSSIFSNIQIILDFKHHTCNKVYTQTVYSNNQGKGYLSTIRFPHLGSETHLSYDFKLKERHKHASLHARHVCSFYTRNEVFWC